MEKKFGASEVNQILKLQQLFYNKILTTDFLHELIALYVRVIQVFSSQISFMKNYFFQKMQFVLSRPQVIKMLQQGGDVAQQIRQTIRATERQQKQFVQDRNFAFAKEKVVQKQTHHHYHYEQNQAKNKQRNLKLDMKVKVMRQVETNMKQLEKQVKQQDRKLEMKGELVKKIKKTQDQKLQQRLAKRKKRLRKKSVEIKPNIQKEDEQPEPVIQKQQLKEAQRQLTTAIYKFTVRMTEKALKKQESSNTKARIKNKKIESIDEDQDLLEQDNQHKDSSNNHGRIKTKRQQNKDSEYW